MQKTLSILLGMLLFSGCAASNQPAHTRSGAILARKDFPEVASNSNFALGELDKNPKPRRMVNPIYPSEEKKNGITAKVVVEFVVNSSGDVSSVTVIEAPSRAFAQAAAAAVWQWKYEPGVKSGRKVNTILQVPITFSLSH